MDFEYIKKQGPLVALLILITWVLYSKIERLEAQIQSCNDEKFQTVVNLQQNSNRVLDQNSLAMDRNTETIELINERLGFGTISYKKKKYIPVVGRPGIGKQ